MKTDDHMERAFAACSLAADNGCIEPVRRRGKTIGAYGWTYTFPTRRAAKHAARKLRQVGYGRHPNRRASDRDGRFYMSRARRRQQEQRDRLLDLLCKLAPLF